MAEYVFEGETVRINARDYARMRDLYPNLNLIHELDQLDFELRGKKKWWPELQAKLNYRNKVADDAKGKSGYRESLAERSNREAREVYADAEAAEASGSAVGKNGATVWPQMGQPKRPN